MKIHRLTETISSNRSFRHPRDAGSSLQVSKIPMTCQDRTPSLPTPTPHPTARVGASQETASGTPGRAHGRTSQASGGACPGIQKREILTPPGCRSPLLRPFRALSLLAALGLLVGVDDCSGETDGDGDGIPSSTDCDDLDPTTYPGALEVCDGTDNNCDGAVDEGLLEVYFQDLDGDGFGSGPPLGPICTVPAGGTGSSNDCNDADPTVHPGSLETCNGRDDNCDGEAEALLEGDSGPRPGWYPDRDGDGFGDSSTVSCLEAPGYIEVLGDCNDADSSIHPGATDQAGDGQDSDCGGTDEAEPHLGLSASSAPTLESALEAAQAGVTVWVGPGTWGSSGLAFPDHDLKLISVAQADRTHLIAQTTELVLEIGSPVTRQSLIQGFTFEGTNLSSGNPLGGALRITAASPILRACVVRQAHASSGISESAGGGGLALSGSHSFLAELSIEDNVAESWGPMTFFECDFCSETGSCSAWDEYMLAYGGGMYVDSSELTLRQVRFSRNTANFGGGFYALNSTLSLSTVEFDRNDAVPLSHCRWSSSRCSLSCTLEVDGGVGDDYELNNSVVEVLEP